MARNFDSLDKMQKRLPDSQNSTRQETTGKTLQLQKWAAFREKVRTTWVGVGAAAEGTSLVPQGISPGPGHLRGFAPWNFTIAPDRRLIFRFHMSTQGRKGHTRSRPYAV